jgi:hypothetical protein
MIDEAFEDPRDACSAHTEPAIRRYFEAGALKRVQDRLVLSDRNFAAGARQDDGERIPHPSALW